MQDRVSAVCDRGQRRGNQFCSEFGNEDVLMRGDCRDRSYLKP